LLHPSIKEKLLPTLKCVFFTNRDENKWISDINANWTRTCQKLDLHKVKNKFTLDQRAIKMGIKVSKTVSLYLAIFVFVVIKI